MGDLFDAASYEGDVGRLRAANGVDVESQDSDGRTALHRAALLGHTACLGALLAAGASVHARTRHGYTPLHYAAVRGRAACARALIAAGADVNRLDSFGYTPFARAVYNEHRGVLKAMLRAGADVRRVHLYEAGFITDADELIHAVQTANGWDNYATRHTATLVSVVFKATRGLLPDAVNVEVASFVAPPGGSY